MNGFGRYIHADGSVIGWLSNDQLHGNGYFLNADGSIKESGWFDGEDGELEEFKKDDQVYKYFEKEDCVANQKW